MDTSTHVPFLFCLWNYILDVVQSLVLQAVVHHHLNSDPPCNLFSSLLINTPNYLLTLAGLNPRSKSRAFSRVELLKIFYLYSICSLVVPCALLLVCCLL